MKRQRKVFLLMGVLAAILALSATNSQARYYPNQEQPRPHVIKGLVTVEFEDGVDVKNAVKSFGSVSFGIPSLDPILADFGVNDFRKLFPWRTEKPKTNSGMRDLTRFYELSYPEDVDVQDVINALLQNPNVRSADAVMAIPVDASPNDPQWSQQWAMEPPGPDPNYYSAWDIETGSDSVIFADIDSGVNYRHPDLQGNIWVNPGEDVDGDNEVYDLDDLNGIDDDGNGRIDDLVGYDFFTGIGIPVWPGEDPGGVDSDPNDHNGHGTHVAGIAAGMNNNNTNITGAAGGWYGGHRSYRGVRIMCIRVGATGQDGLGYVNSNNCATGIDYAVMMGADVINASWGGAAVNAAAAGNAVASGVTFCHAAGNGNCDCPDELDGVPGVLSVAGTGGSSGGTDVKYTASNFGFWIDVSAPGANILSTNSWQYVPSTANFWGTSMASPMVGGLALLIRSAMPSLSKAQVDSIILLTADNIDGVNPSYPSQLGTGRINAFTALSALASAQFTSDVTDGNVPLTVNFTDLSPYSPTSWEWSFGTGDSSDAQNPQYTYSTPGIYDVSLVVDDTCSLGPGEEHLRNYIWAQADTLKMDSTESAVGTQIVIPVYLANTAQVKEIQFAFRLEDHNGTISLDSASVVGLRTEYFDNVSKIVSDQANEQFVYLMQTNLPGSGYSDYMLPDTGAILNLYIWVHPNAAPSQVVTIDTATVAARQSYIKTIWGNYWPDAHTPGKVTIRFCAHGDCNCDGDILVDDLSMLVDYLFRGGPPPDGRGGDVNGFGGILVDDVTYLVDYLFKQGPPPPP